MTETEVAPRACGQCGKPVVDQSRRVVDQADCGNGYLEVLVVAVENLPCGHVWQCIPGQESKALIEQT